jgi:preprotein translocase subunit SecD
LARSTPVRKAWRSLAWLGVIIVVLAGINLLGTIFSTASWAPKLALDLQGGTSITLGAQIEGGAPSAEQLNQAVTIIRDRIDASGVAEAEVTTQGDRNVVVAIPGEPDAQTLQRIQSTAKLEFRPVIFTDVATPDSAGTTPSPTETPGADGTMTPVPTPSLADTRTAEPTDASDPNWVTPALYDQYLNFQCSSLEDTDPNLAPTDEPLITCQDDGSVKFILGPVEVAGEDISDARGGQVPNSQGQNTGVWGVFITFNGEGTEKFAAVTQRLFGFPQDDPRNRFAIVLDGRVISAPTTQAAITDGKPVISGSFTQDSSKILADQLKFGALPIAFEVLSNETISATLGGTQLNSGLIAGLIGLILVIGYSLFQYRALASVTIASLVVAAVLTYLVLLLVSWRMGYRLSLAGVAGLIVAIGLTVDSFIVYFERIRDELRDGRSLVGAVDAGWARALRTILAAKSINLISAVVLYILAIGNVRGFAFTLGITVVIDVLVVVLFTHPMMQLLATTRFFSSGHPLSGLDPNALGAVYRGRAQFRTPVIAGKNGASREAIKRQTIAERKAEAASGADRKDS